ncbi:GGDEF domain-containing protein [Vibrio vulnificus]|uniref:GGDEF domain-containing protein n=1 Tax=Vibrio vulnificus TaxID=672 RepID=UPI001A27B3AD|nr:sensor domain-containing diguanylate cyclase [Vibrio vulnificus]ELM6649091.1 sensor domain-containing diguanylate cyclase [Vibrio vulnificus]MCG6288477.1 sensor domain-containing diguanylate cyclase [Vibrio vulnificus]HAS6228847.1 diguanylate cyclase [Vibrio vulnificus]HAS6303022.1 diguanylate cyclase [Vibrio vulnificus]HDY7454104.1 sensor domain-containing diguanylate cyclase [Vibrio vulnificus]
MQTPKKPDNEPQRIADLHSLNILDTAAEERFDRVTRIARRLFDVPIALVSLVDEDRQWFKSCFGLNASETPRDISFCGHAILGADTLIVEDASQDARFADNPLVTGEPHIRFYAGVPLMFEHSSCLGTLCIIDTKPRTLNEDERLDLIDLAKMAERELAATHSASIDDLTQISNRRGFMTLAKKSMAYCEVGDYPYSIAYLDLNGFKPINDQFGHQEGDRALKAFADTMKKSFRESDVFARLGGDEFVVFMSGASRSVAQIAIQRFTEALQRYNQSANRGYDLSFCAGIVSVEPDANISLDELLSQADKAMYQQKGNKTPRS